MTISPFWKATGERMLRGGVAAVFAAYVGGTVIFDVTNIHTLKQVLVLALGGAFSALALSLGGNAVSGNGPSFTKQEVVTPAPPTNQAGVVNVDVLLILTILNTIGIAILLFHGRFH